MNCRKCGNLLNENDPICRICGEPVNLGTPTPNQVNQGTINQGMPNPNQGYQNVASNLEQPVNAQQVPTQQMPNPNNYGYNNANNGQTAMPMTPNYGNQVPPMNNVANQGIVPQSPKNSNKGFIIILIVLLLIIAGLGGFIGYKALTNNTETKEPAKKTTDDKKDSDKDNDKDKDDEDDDKKEKDPNQNKKTHLLSGFTFVLPDDLVYNNTNESITAMDNVASPSIYFNFYVENYSYATALLGISEIANELTQEGYTVLNHGKVNYGTTEFYCFIISKDGVTGVSYLTSLDSTRAAGGFVMGVTENDIDTAFEKIKYIVENASRVDGFAPNDNEDKYTGLKGLDELQNQNIQGATYTIK